MPSVNSLLTKMTPKEGISRIFSFNQSFSYIGQVLGPLLVSSCDRSRLSLGFLCDGNDRLLEILSGP